MRSLLACTAAFLAVAPVSAAALTDAQRHAHLDWKTLPPGGKAAPTSRSH